MKFWFWVCLALVLALSCFSLCGAAVPAKEEASQYPMVIVPGYSSSPLVLTNDDGSTEQLWGINMDNVLQAVLNHLAELIAELGLAAAGINAEYIADTLGEAVLDFCGKLACNPDGTSANNISQMFPNDAEFCNAANLYSIYNDARLYQWEPDIVGEMLDSIGGRENVYNFNCDFRMGTIENAEKLHDFIEDILATTGAEKVNLFAISHGGQITSTYINLDAEDCHIHNTVMTVPAIGGAALALDAMTNNIVFDEYTLLRFVENGMVLEEDYHILVEAQQLGFLDDILHYFVPYALQVIGYWGSMWDFLPAEDYEQLKARLLDPVESAPLIAKSDRMHALMGTMRERFAVAEAAGTNINLIAGCGTAAVTGTPRNSDGIIALNDSTGATCAPFGQRFADGYIQQEASEHRYVSPSMEVDASTCYLPDNTWFVDGLFHGMTYWDAYTKELTYTLLLTDDIADVWDDPAYPQFHASTNACHGVHGAFTQSADGFFTESDDGFTITNLSTEHEMRILAVEANGLAVQIELPGGKLQPGESVTTAVTLTGAQQGLTKGSVTITYVEYGNLTPYGQRTLDFTKTDGEPAVYDAENPLCDAEEKTIVERVFGDAGTKLLKKTGLLWLFEVVFSSIRMLFSGFVGKIGGVC